MMPAAWCASSFAVGAALTGTFSLPSAAGKFMVVALGGIMVGLLIAMFIGKVNQFLVQRTGRPAIQIMISLLIPFVSYLAAEHLGVRHSGRSGSRYRHAL